LPSFYATSFLDGDKRSEGFKEFLTEDCGIEEERLVPLMGQFFKKLMKEEGFTAPTVCLESFV
jgi:hypothetical protein